MARGSGRTHDDSAHVHAIIWLFFPRMIYFSYLLFQDGFWSRASLRVDNLIKPLSFNSIVRIQMNASLVGSVDMKAKRIPAAQTELLLSSGRPGRSKSSDCHAAQHALALALTPVVPCSMYPTFMK